MCYKMNFKESKKITKFLYGAKNYDFSIKINRKTRIIKILKTTPSKSVFLTFCRDFLGVIKKAFILVVFSLKKIVSILRKIIENY